MMVMDGLSFFSPSISFSFCGSSDCLVLLAHATATHSDLGDKSKGYSIGKRT